MFKFLQIAMVFGICLQAHGQAADPTKPLNYAPVGASVSQEEGIQLTSILIAQDRKVAIINGQSLRELQTVKGAGAIVKKIEADAVTLQQGNKVWRVALNKTAVRK